MKLVNPWIEVESNSKEVHFKIGNGFQGDLTTSSGCRYYSTDERVFYVCNLIDPNEALTFRDVKRSEFRSSFSPDLVCPSSGRGGCIRISNCNRVV